MILEVKTQFLFGFLSLKTVKAKLSRDFFENILQYLSYLFVN